MLAVKPLSLTCSPLRYVTLELSCDGSDKERTQQPTAHQIVCFSNTLEEMTHFVAHWKRRMFVCVHLSVGSYKLSQGGSEAAWRPPQSAASIYVSCSCCLMRREPGHKCSSRCHWGLTNDDYWTSSLCFHCRCTEGLMLFMT